MCACCFCVISSLLISVAHLSFRHQNSLPSSKFIQLVCSGVKLAMLEPISLCWLYTCGEGSDQARITSNAHVPSESDLQKLRSIFQKPTLNWKDYFLLHHYLMFFNWIIFQFVRIIHQHSTCQLKLPHWRTSNSSQSSQQRSDFRSGNILYLVFESSR